MASYDYIFLSAFPKPEQTANSDIHSAPSADTKAAYIAPLLPFHPLEENGSDAETVRVFHDVVPNANAAT